MSTIENTTIQPLAATGLFPSLALWGGAWAISTEGLNPGDYLLTSPDACEVVTIAQDYHGARAYTCTCCVERFDNPVADSGDGCIHIGLVGLFLKVPVETLAGDLGRAVHVLRNLIRKQVDDPTNATRDALITKQAERVAVLKGWYVARKQARVAVIPRRLTQAAEQAQTEGASAPSPAGDFASWFWAPSESDPLADPDGDDLADMAAQFAPRVCACGAVISAEASACLDCDPGQYESDRLFDVAPARQAWFTPRPPTVSPALAGAVVELWGAAPVLAEVA